MNLKEKFTQLLLKIGLSDKEALQNWLNLEKSYSKKSRHYHNLTHINAMIESFEIYEDQFEHPDEILFSIFYHDYIYVSSKKDNELKSAEYALSVLPENSTANRQLIFDAICATQQHLHHINDDINLMLDFDLKILASNWNDYQIYAEQIRKEYRIYPDFLYKPGRAKALKHFLENDFIFQTNEFRELHEKKARFNIEKEILLLTS